MRSSHVTAPSRSGPASSQNEGGVPSGWEEVFHCSMVRLCRRWDGMCPGAPCLTSVGASVTWGSVAWPCLLVVCRWQSHGLAMGHIFGKLLCFSRLLLRS